jgi:hypothetical protein
MCVDARWSAYASREVYRSMKASLREPWSSLYAVNSIFPDSARTAAINSALLEDYGPDEALRIIELDEIGRHVGTPPDNSEQHLFCGQTPGDHVGQHCGQLVRLRANIVGHEDIPNRFLYTHVWSVRRHPR